ncbi:maltose alpha-D-glucosyltransferase [Spongisporangium articulatum]|uniref:maltose alpha-D-glucosyltransferase n=1 Tax=Spongisporangium articulatum TaxID=3362603 RepID=A0ABW8AN97_9ACTN
MARSSSSSTASPGLQYDPQWYRKAVFYEVLVRAFADSNGSGSGDFTGLIGKLDYIQSLGVDCLWLPPFYASPLRDGGYDIADYCSVLPEFGTLPDFQEFVAQAHARGLRVITDLVINHTSDAHPWFQASRSDPDGPYGDFYVWSDDDQRYADARIIFVDTETSNWTFDPVRRQFFWHRFFSHQPDLNFENPAVQEAIFDVVRFWMDMGIDGFRLDAVPYLFEEEGTNCENLPQTHTFLRTLRGVIDTEYPGRVLLAEANQWPKDVVAYFGTEDDPECHMCFHFPVMPRIYYSLREERAKPIIDILAETPEIPSHGQWGTFLRNHDELTLEMVTTEERAAMYGWYAPDPRMRANIGIRRRLSSLLDGHRGEIELANALLLSLPGSPTLYYGDEIGMGDNIWLPDRDAVRTPMQWTPDRNAGFSTADPGKLYLPTIQSLNYHYAALNVESQQATSSSLLNWTRSMLQLRREHPAFGMGSYVAVDADNPAVLAFLRVLAPDPDQGVAGEVLLCVNNLSRTAQATRLRLPEWVRGGTLDDVFGGTGFGEVSLDGVQPLTLGSRDFFWLTVSGVTPVQEGRAYPAAGAELGETEGAAAGQARETAGGGG